jgi:hypothetical protein
MKKLLTILYLIFLCMLLSSSANADNKKRHNQKKYHACKESKDPSWKHYNKPRDGKRKWLIF